MKAYYLTFVLIGALISFIPVCAAAESTGPESNGPKSNDTSSNNLGIRPVEVSSVDVFDVLSHLPKADIAFARGDFKLAMQHYRYVHLHDPKQSRAAIGYADSALALGQTALASQVYKGVSVNNTRAQSGLLLTDILTQNIENPEAQLRAHLKKAPDDARLWNMLGQVLDTDNRGIDARQAYATAQLAGQRAGLAHNNIGQSLLKESRMAEALEEFTRANHAAPHSRLFDNNRRLTLLLQKDYTQALHQLDKDRASQLLKDAGVIAARQGDVKLALYFLENSIALNPVYDAQAVQYLARLNQ